jgi:hypothetical protein
LPYAVKPHSVERTFPQTQYPYLEEMFLPLLHAVLTSMPSCQTMIQEVTNGGSTFSLSTVLINTKIIPVYQLLKNIYKQLKLESFLSILYVVLMNMLKNVTVPCFVTK